jgi:hypothetical protein
MRYTAARVGKFDPMTGELLAVYDSLREAGKKNFVHFTAISDACNGLSHTSANNKWRYIRINWKKLVPKIEEGDYEIFEPDME